MSWDITHVIESLLGVIIGGLITLLVNLHLQRKEREVEYLTEQHGLTIDEQGFVHAPALQALEKGLAAWMEEYE